MSRHVLRALVLTHALGLLAACDDSSAQSDKDASVASVVDASTVDGGRSDAGADAATADGGASDASAGDASTNDAGSSDASAPDAQVGNLPSSASVFFFGHSLVDQDMPTMVGSLAAARGKSYTTHGQLGWGTSLAAHWGWDGMLNGSAPAGFSDENRAPFFIGEGKAQLTTGNYDVVVLTETNGQTKQLSATSQTAADVLRFVDHARKTRPNIRVFLYSNWLDRDEDFGGDLAAWQQKTEQDIAWWEDVADRVNAQLSGPDIGVIPGGPVLVKVTRAIGEGKLPGLTVNDLFRKNGSETDGVHVSDQGFYVIALLHYAAIFRDTPVGLPAQTAREDGPATALSAAHAATIQNIVWMAVKSYPRAGI